MKVSSIKLYTDQDVWIIEEFLSPDIVQLALNICDTYYTDRDDWHNAEWTKLRFIHSGQTTDWQKLREEFMAGHVFQHMCKILQKDLSFGEMQLWCDLPGYGPLLPHCENSGQVQGQLYLTKQNSNKYPTNGTSIHNMEKEILFTLPYRNNIAWLFRDCQQVMHGRETDVPVGLERFSLIFWYSDKV